MYVYVTDNSYDGVNWVFKNKDKIPETMGGGKVEIVTQGELME